MKKTSLVASTILAAALGACTDPGTPGEVSTCGGFEGLAAHALTNAAVDDYCAAEVLVWTYDATAETLSLSNERVSLNCCGEHSVALRQTGDTTFAMAEVDAPESGDARCGCMCVFDFRVTGEQVPDGVITLELTREVTDSEDPFTEVWSGELDLGAGAGSIVVDTTDLEMWCDPNWTE